MYSFSASFNFISIKRAAYAVVLALISFLFTTNTMAAAGNLDRSFGENGKAIAYINGAEKLFDIAVQPDGKIVAVGGASATGAFWDFIVLRYNADGTPDAGFGTGGRAIVSVVAGSDAANAVVIQPDGKIVVGGYAQNAAGSSDFAILRLNADGSRDEGFGVKGATTFSVGTVSGDNVSGLALQASGNETRIIAVGPSGTAPLQFAAIRLSANGAVDNGFGTNGVSIISVGGFQDSAADVAVDSAQRIVIGGTYRFNAGGGSFRDDFAVVRLTADGAPDTTFSGDGKLTTNFSTLSAIRSVQIANIGGEEKIYASGIVFRNSANDFAVVRYKSNGDLDTTFNTTGRVMTAVGTNEDQIHDSVVQPDGKLIVAGFTGNGTNGSNKDFALMRYNVNGTIDTSFGSCGKIVTHIGSNVDIAWGVALQEDGRVVATGEVQNGSTSVDGAITRYKPAGGASATTKDFDGDGREDVSVFRPSDGSWYMNCSCQGMRATRFGQAGDVPVAADYDGDGKTDVAVFRAGAWYINRTSDGQLGVINFGVAGDIPTVGDYDGDEKADASVWRESAGMWYILRSSDGQFATRAAGGAGDKPVPADYDRDGKTDIAIYHAGEWWIANSSTGGNFTVTPFGSASDTPLAGDFDGDGKDDLSVYRAPEGMWYQQLSAAGYKAAKWGIETDNPVPADYDGDSRTDLAVYRGGMWYIMQSTTNTYVAVSWGLPTDIPAVK
jgi:uncharacterized delta-60 repeat protein